MTREQARNAVIESLRRLLGKDDLEINGRTRPIGDLGLESQDGIAWSIDLEDLGFRIPSDLNPLVDDQRHRARTVDEIAEFILNYAA